MTQATKNIPDLHWRYRTVDLLGQGGQAGVYLAEDRLSGKTVVLKSSSRNSGRDLKREFILLYRLNHPGLPEAYDLYRQEGQALAALEYCPGVTLDRYLEQNRPGQEGLWDIWSHLAGIVAYLHRRDLIHGDIKPENILIDQEGRIKLIDLGLARRTGDGSVPGFAGTAGYSAPEVLNGSTGSTQSSDVYSLGLLLFQMVAGQVPEARERLEENRPWSLRLKECLDDKRSEIGIRALSYWPQERFLSAQQLVQALAQSGCGIAAERPSGFRYTGQNRALVQAVKLMHTGTPSRSVVSAAPGRGKTAFLKELNFILQAAGHDSAYVNAGDLPEKYYQTIPPHVILLVDALGDEKLPDWLEKRPGRSITAASTSKGQSQAKPMVSLARFTKRDYSAALAGQLAGIRGWELDNLSGWLWRNAGSNLSHARSYLDQCQHNSAIIYKNGQWKVDWQKILAGQAIPDNVRAGIGERWQKLDASARQALIALGLGQDSPPQGPVIAEIAEPDYWLDESGRIDGDILRAFILEQIEDPAKEGIKEQPVPDAGYEHPSMARWQFWAGLGMKEQWLAEGQSLINRAREERDLEMMLYAGRQLADSGRLDKPERVRMARELTALYQRLNRWTPAVELWESLATQFSGEWEYHQALTKLHANNGEPDRALEALEQGSKVLKDDDQKCLYLAYKGWVLGLKGRKEEGADFLKRALEAAGSGARALRA